MASPGPVLPLNLRPATAWIALATLANLAAVATLTAFAGGSPEVLTYTLVALVGALAGVAVPGPRA